MLIRLQSSGMARLAAVVTLAAVASCGNKASQTDAGPEQPDAGPGQTDAGGDAGPTFKTDLTDGKYGDPLPGLSADELMRFTDGRVAFRHEEFSVTGLGPVFNDSFCADCHDSPPAIGGTNDRLETRFGFRDNDGGFDPLVSLGGPLLQNFGIGAVPGHVFVGEVVPAEANVVAPRRTQPLFGLGLVDATPDTTFQEIAAAQAANAPEAAGRPAIVTDGRGPPAVGKFGWKGAISTLLEFSGNAALNEMGITSPQFPNEVCPQGDCTALAFNPVPALNDPNGQAVANFSDFMTFNGPPPAPLLDGGVARGSELFESIGCAVCHLPTIVTGPNASPAFDQVAYHPYSDFLLHDMGTLGDGIDEGDARGGEMRTQPLWGLSKQSRLMHDGRTESVTEAIAAHDGQGAMARDRFAALGDADQAALLAFLAAL